MDGNNKWKVQEVKKNCLIISLEHGLQKNCISAFSLVETLQGMTPAVQLGQGLKQVAVFMNKRSLDTLPYLNLSVFCELTPCQQRACASPTNLSICFARIFYLLACESYCSCVFPSCGVLGLGIFKEIFAFFAC